MIDLRKKILYDLEARFGPRLLVEFFAECFEPTPAHRIALSWRVSLIEVSVVRQNPSMVIEYVIGHLRRRRPIPAFHHAAYLWNQNRQRASSLADGSDDSLGESSSRSQKTKRASIPA